MQLLIMKGMFFMELVLDHVTKRFRDKTAAEDICLKLTPGVWGLLGANGAGKPL